MRLILGTANLGAAYGITNRSLMMNGADAEHLLTRARALGIRMLDTAQAYPESEARIGAWIARHDESFGVVSKAPKLASVSETDVRSHLHGACRRSLELLGLKRLDGYLLHDADDLARPVVADALQALLDEGLVGAIGVSIYDPAQGFAALNFASTSLLQVPFNLFDRRFVSSGLSDACRARRVTVIARSVFLQGILAAGEAPDRLADLRPHLAALADLAKAEGTSVLSLSLRYVYQHRGIDQVIVGAQTADQLGMTVNELNAGPLSRKVLHSLSQIGQKVPARLTDPRHWPQDPISQSDRAPQA